MKTVYNKCSAEGCVDLAPASLHEALENSTLIPEPTYG